MAKRGYPKLPSNLRRKIKNFRKNFTLWKSFFLNVHKEIRLDTVAENTVKGYT